MRNALRPPDRHDATPPVEAEGPPTTALQRAALRFNRRGFIGRAGAATFGALAGFSVGASPVYAGGCTGPYGAGNCRAGGATCFCTTKPCGESCYGPLVTNVSQTFCGGQAEASYCWESAGHACCDCHVQEWHYSWYCYCHYPT